MTLPPSLQSNRDLADSKRKTDNSLPLIGSPAHAINTAGLFDF